MGYSNLKEIVDTIESGAKRVFTFRKTPSQASTAGVWFDISMSPGNPVPNYYAASPLVAVQMKQSTDGGLFHGSDVSSGEKYISSITMAVSAITGMPMPITLVDYLLYYPFIDEGTTDEQILDNTLTLPRYTDGEGVRIMAVSVAPRTGGQQFTVSYTNQSGVSGRTTTVVYQNTAAANGSIISSSENSVASSVPFLPLQGTDTGVRSIESVTMVGPDVGLFTLVLVKPIISTTMIEQTAAVEVNFFNRGLILPAFENDAYLNFICQPNGSLSGITFIGEINYIWN